MAEENNNSSLSVFVTGATEGLGRAVTRQLVARGHQVTGMARNREEANLVRADGGLPVYNDLFRASEIASTMKMAKAGVVVNCAPQHMNGLPIGDPDWEYFLRLLDEGAVAIAEAAAQAEAQFVVHTSFAFLYGDTHGDAANEDAHITTDNPLIKSAAAAEQAILNSEVPGCVLRAGFNYGPGNAITEALHQALINGTGLSSVNSDNAASWVHGADLAQAIVLAAEQQPAGEVFNVASDKPVTVNDFVDQFADAVGVARPTRRDMPQIIENLTTPALTRSLMSITFQVSSAKAKEQLGWSPDYADLDAGIEQTLLAWRAAEAG